MDPRNPPYVVEAWDGREWAAVDLILDETGGLNRNGDMEFLIEEHLPSIVAGVQGADQRLIFGVERRGGAGERRARREAGGAAGEAGDARPAPVADDGAGHLVFAELADEALTAEQQQHSHPRRAHGVTGSKPGAAAKCPESRATQATVEQARRSEPVSSRCHFSARAPGC